MSERIYWIWACDPGTEEFFLCHPGQKRMVMKQRGEENARIVVQPDPRVVRGVSLAANLDVLRHIYGIQDSVRADCERMGLSFPPACTPEGEVR